jgi:hypothetical protein
MVLLRIEPAISVSVAKNSEHWTTEAIIYLPLLSQLAKCQNISKIWGFYGGVYEKLLRIVPQLLFPANVVPSSIILVTVKMEAILSSGTSYLQDSLGVTSRKTEFNMSNDKPAAVPLHKVWTRSRIWLCEGLVCRLTASVVSWSDFLAADTEAPFDSRRY